MSSGFLITFQVSVGEGSSEAQAKAAYHEQVLILPRLVIWRGPRDHLSSEICVAGVSERFPEGCLGFVWGLPGGVWGCLGVVWAQTLRDLSSGSQQV